jgi:hypothetical protein
MNLPVIEVILLLIIACFLFILFVILLSAFCDVGAIQQCFNMISQSIS